MFVPWKYFEFLPISSEGKASALSSEQKVMLGNGTNDSNGDKHSDFSVYLIHAACHTYTEALHELLIESSQPWRVWAVTLFILHFKLRQHNLSKITELVRMVLGFKPD